MIHHYINLVCWQPMIEVFSDKRDFVWVDSYSLSLAISRFRTDAIYRPGTRGFEEIGQNDPTYRNWYFLTAHPIDNLPQNKQYSLPFFNTVSIPAALKAKILELPAGMNIAIGISSPKQNYLAIELHKIRADLEYHCFGAAITAVDSAKQKKAHGRSLSGSGFEWVHFFIRSPKRTMEKILLTIKQLYCIYFNQRTKSKFKEFSDICMPLSRKEGRIHCNTCERLGDN